MAVDPFAHQDAAGMSGSPLGVFLDGQFVQSVAHDDPLGEEARRTAAASTGHHEADFEVLVTCPTHPDTAMVDCLTCWPEEA